ncbi:hypothetical protein [Romeriopsis navalis]|nr:hypothetical protein [Romeriopsis navalis]
MLLFLQPDGGAARSVGEFVWQSKSPRATGGAGINEGMHGF